MMEGEDQSSVPASLFPKHKTPTHIKTRKERKQNLVMREAEKRTQESLERMQNNAENSFMPCEDGATANCRV